MPQAPDLWTWLLIPAIGGVIGWSTNWLAVKMIFRPIRPVRVLGFRLQGLVPRRQQDLAKAIGRVVGAHLVEHQDIVRSLDEIDLAAALGSVLDRGLGPKIGELRSLPLIGGFLTEERVGDIKQSIVRGVLQHKAAVLEEIERGLERGLDVPRLVEQKVAAFAVERLERLILEVASRELRAIVVLGGLLGVLLGALQVGYLWLRG
ncbi:MAG: DUF445 family protein [Planctomycetes bacterium]|nr:DUF445 family protein [Planctomycetota bacterium]